MCLCHTTMAVTVSASSSRTAFRVERDLGGRHLWWLGVRGESVGGGERRLRCGSPSPNHGAWWGRAFPLAALGCFGLSRWAGSWLVTSSSRFRGCTFALGSPPGCCSGMGPLCWLRFFYALVYRLLPKGGFVWVGWISCGRMPWMSWLAAVPGRTGRTGMRDASCRSLDA